MAEKAVFTVIEGKDRGMSVSLAKHCCKVIGRQIDIGNLNADRTQIIPKRLDLRDNEIKRINSILLANKFEQIDSLERIDSSFKRTSDFIIDDEKISRLHAMIFNTGSFIGIIDLASTNGTLIDGEKIEIGKLSGAETITVGNTKISCKID